MEVIDALAASRGMKGYRVVSKQNARGEHVVAVIGRRRRHERGNDLPVVERC